MAKKNGKELPARPLLPSLDSIPAKHLNYLKRDVLASGPHGRDPVKEISPFDFDGLPTDASDEEILAWVSVWGVPERFTRNELLPTDLLAGRPVALSERYYRFLNEQYKEILSYMKERWGMGPYIAWTRGVEDKVFRTQKDIVDFMRVTIDARHKKGRSEEGVVYCAIANLMYAAVVLDDIGIEEIMKTAESLESQMIDGVQDVKGNLLIPPLFAKFTRRHDVVENDVVIGDDSEAKFQMPKNAESAHVMFSLRGKNFRSALDRIQQPRGSGETVLTDGVGMRFVVDKEALGAVLERTLAWHAKYWGINKIYIEDQGIVSSDELEMIVEKVRVHPALRAHVIEIIPSVHNEASSGRFRALKVLAEGTKNNKIRYEMQFVLPFNRNNKKDSDHAVYEAARDIMNLTRLFGSCPEHCYTYIIERTQKELERKQSKNTAPIRKEKVEQMLRDRGVRKLGKIIVHEAIYKRWKDLHWITESEFEQYSKTTRQGRRARREEGDK